MSAATAAVASVGRDVLRGGYVRLYPGEVAAALERARAAEVLEVLSPDRGAAAARVLERLSPDLGAAVLEEADAAFLAATLPEVDAARAAMLLSRLGDEERDERLGHVGAATAAELRALLEYPADSAAHLMDPRVTAFREDATVGDVLERIRALGRRRIQDVYVVDDDGRLAGAVALQDIAVAEPSEALLELARREPSRVQATATREDVVQEFADRKAGNLPVVDYDDRLLGVIRPDAFLQAVEAEASMDIQTMVGVSKEERALSSASFAVRKRLPWLEINLLTAFLAASVVGIFEDTIARYSALAVLLPVVAGQSGNTGAQALAVTMRGLALREIRLSSWMRVSRKEVAVAFVNGLAVAATTSAGVWVWSRSTGLALVIGLSMVISMVAAGLSGACVPMVLTALKQDPAQSSSIILTTVTDIVGFFSFLGIATMLSGML